MQPNSSMKATTTSKTQKKQEIEIPDSFPKIYSGHDGGRICEWNLKTNECTRVLEKHTNDVWCLLYDVQTRRIFSGSADKTIKIWCEATGDCLTSLEGHSEGIQCLDIAGPKLVTGSVDCTIRVWDTDKKKCVNILRHPDSVQSVTFVPGNPNKLVSSSLDRTIRIWDVSTSKVVQKLEGHKKPPRVIISSGDYLVSGDMDGVIKVWSLRMGDCLRTLNEHTQEISALRVHPTNHKIFFSASQDLSVRLFNMETGVCSRKLKTFSNLSNGLHINEHRIYGAGYEGILVLDSDYGNMIGQLATSRQ